MKKYGLKVMINYLQEAVERSCANRLADGGEDWSVPAREGAE